LPRAAAPLFRVALAAALFAFCALGCKSRDRRGDLPKDVVAKRWTDACQAPGTYVEHDRVMVEGLAVALSGNAKPATPARPLNLLALSAGGKYGAYTAGVLAGWQCTGTRPEFDVVTGVSSGAIIAVYAFLGPQYDDKVRQFFTETESRELFKWRPLRYLIHYGSLASSKPLQGIIEREINSQVLAEIRAAHVAGRRLYLASLNIQSKQPCLWDVGALACSGRPDADELVRKVILACCSIPGMVPPVEFDVVVDGCHYKEIHGDGGAVTQSYMQLATHQAEPQPGGKWLEGSKLYIIAAGKYYSDPTSARMSFISRLSTSVSASLYALYRAELCKMYAFCLVSGCDYNVVALDPAFQVDDPRSMTFSPEAMKALYDEGVRQARCGVPWRKLPPGGLTGEDVQPRTGTCFITKP
jgi:hypothetical protein